jgi:hypothetical protein
MIWGELLTIIMYCMRELETWKNYPGTWHEQNVIYLVHYNYSYILNINIEGPSSRSWSYGSWLYNYLCNQCLSPLKLVVAVSCLMPLSTIFQLCHGSQLFDATFNNISVMSWQCFIGGVARENHRPVASRWQTLITQCCIEYTSPWAEFELTTLVVSRNL